MASLHFTTWWVPLPLRGVALAMVLGGLATTAWSLDLMQAYDAALEQDASIRASRAAAEAGRERLPQARAQLLPSLSASAGRNKNRLDSTAPNLLGQEATTHSDYFSYNRTLTLRQPVYRPQQMAQYRQAKAQVEDVEATLARDLQDVGVRVGGAYFEALLARDQLALVQAQKTAYRVQVDAARKALAAGSGTRTDIDDAQARLDMALAQELEARQNLDFTARQLQALVNQPVTVDGLASLEAERLPLQPPMPAGVEEWVAQAEQHSPEIQALKARIEAARQEVAKAEAGHYPTLDAVAQWSRSGSENVLNPRSSYANQAVGVQLTVPIYAGGYVSSTVRQALAQQQQAEELLEAARRDLGVRVHKEFRGVTEGVLRVQALAQAVRSAEQLVLSSRKSFQAGSRTLVDVLNAEQQRMLAQRDLAQARYLYLVSRIRLQALAGADLRPVMAEINGWLKS